MICLPKFCSKSLELVEKTRKIRQKTNNSHKNKQKEAENDNKNALETQKTAEKHDKHSL